MSPRQIMVIPISEKAADYCESVYLYFHQLGYDAELYRGEGQLNKKIRNSQLAQWNYILVAGENEMANGTVNVRTREDGREGELKVDAFAIRLKREMPQESQSHKNFYSRVWKASDFGLEPKNVQGIRSATILPKQPEIAESSPKAAESSPETKADSSEAIGQIEIKL